MERKNIIIITAAIIVVFVVAFLIGYFSRSTSCEKIPLNKKPNTGAMTDAELDKVHQSIADLMKTDELRANMRYFARKPHVAGTPQTFENTKEIHNRFTAYGFSATFHEYNVLLSFPKIKDPNFVYIIDEKNGNKELFKSRAIEKFLIPDENQTDALPPFLAYAPSGDVTGDLVYVNYGRKEDFDYLVEKKKINFTGKIVIGKYGTMGGRGGKIANAAKYGAVGCLIYGDPKFYAPVASKKFPNGRWLSDDGVQRGTGIGRTAAHGDPMTGGYPSKDWAFRPEIANVTGLPTIPVQPIAASDAKELMKLLGGDDVPEDWKGDLNITYKVGPISNSSIKVRLVVKNTLEVKRIRNVCGTIRGSIEPDRYVLLGNHIDSWVNGAVDATSGTTVMMEIARALGEKYKTGWKPRRTIRLCGWDGEEFGLIGSTEYVEEYFSQLYDKAIAYINIDSAVAGNDSLQSSASPLLHNMMFSADKQVPDPYRAETVYDRRKLEYKDKNYKETPPVHRLGAGSDYFAFYKFVGIPSINMIYSQTELNKIYNTSYYPQYHTLHDTVYWMENFVDKEYKIHLTVAKVGMLYLLKLADTAVLPFTITRYQEAIKRGIDAIAEVMKEKKIVNVDNLLGPLTMASTNFTSAATTFTAYLTEVKEDQEKMQNALFVRMLNDKLMQLEKGFTYPNGLPGNPQVKHYLMQSSSNRKADSTCPIPAVADLVESVANGEKIDEFKRQVTITASLIQAVAESLNVDIE